MLRKANPEDVALILKFIKGIAEYEHLSAQVKANEQLLKEWLFDRRVAEVIFVLDHGLEVGFVLFFYNFSTFEGRAGIYIEDLFVMPEYRGKGYGKELMSYLISKAKQENLGRMEWTCLDWNTPSINFYKSLGASPMDGWTNFRLTIDDIREK